MHCFQSTNGPPPQLVANLHHEQDITTVMYFLSLSLSPARDFASPSLPTRLLSQPHHPPNLYPVPSHPTTSSHTHTLSLPRRPPPLPPPPSSFFDLSFVRDRRIRVAHGRSVQGLKASGWRRGDQNRFLFATF